jgi:hypothetical protein
MDFYLSRLHSMLNTEMAMWETFATQNKEWLPSRCLSTSTDTVFPGIVVSNWNCICPLRDSAAAWTRLMLKRLQRWVEDCLMCFALCLKTDRCFDHSQANALLDFLLSLVSGLDVLKAGEFPDTHASSWEPGQMFDRMILTFLFHQSAAATCGPNDMLELLVPKITNS